MEGEKIHSRGQVHKLRILEEKKRNFVSILLRKINSRSSIFPYPFIFHVVSSSYILSSSTRKIEEERKKNCFPVVTLGRYKVCHRRGNWYARAQYKYNTESVTSNSCTFYFFTGARSTIWLDNTSRSVYAIPLVSSIFFIPDENISNFRKTREGKKCFECTQIFETFSLRRTTRSLLTRTIGENQSIVLFSKIFNLFHFTPPPSLTLFLTKLLRG